jgi:hypothetical protein
MSIGYAAHLYVALTLLQLYLPNQAKINYEKDLQGFNIVSVSGFCAGMRTLHGRMCNEP